MSRNANFATLSRLGSARCAARISNLAAAVLATTLFTSAASALTPTTTRGDLQMGTFNIAGADAAAAELPTFGTSAFFQANVAQNRGANFAMISPGFGFHKVTDAAGVATITNAAGGTFANQSLIPSAGPTSVNLPGGGVARNWYAAVGTAPGVVGGGGIAWAGIVNGVKRTEVKDNTPIGQGSIMVAAGNAKLENQTGFNYPAPGLRTGLAWSIGGKFAIGSPRQTAVSLVANYTPPGGGAAINLPAIVLAVSGNLATDYAGVFDMTNPAAPVTITRAVYNGLDLPRVRTQANNAAGSYTGVASIREFTTVEGATTFVNFKAYGLAYSTGFTGFQTGQSSTVNVSLTMIGDPDSEVWYEPIDPEYLAEANQPDFGIGDDGQVPEPASVAMAVVALCAVGSFRKFA